MAKDRFGIEITENPRQSATGKLPADAALSNLAPADVLLQYPQAVGYDHVGRMYVITNSDSLLYWNGQWWTNPGWR